jgi:structural maintenance of chromosome 4
LLYFVLTLDILLGFRPENVPRLFDLIKVKDERVKPAFYFGLRDTLVANTIEQASRVAYGRTRFRVVSLTGEIIETSGLILI